MKKSFIIETTTDPQLEVARCRTRVDGVPGPDEIAVIVYGDDSETSDEVVAYATISKDEAVNLAYVLLKLAREKETIN
jgi:hypothetical protein